MLIVSNYTSLSLNKLADAVVFTTVGLAMVESQQNSTALNLDHLIQEITAVAEQYPENDAIQLLFSHQTIARSMEAIGFPSRLHPELLDGTTVADMAIYKVIDALVTLSPQASASELQTYKEFLCECANRATTTTSHALTRLKDIIGV